MVWVADILAKYRVHEDGRTTYELTTQHVWKGKAIGFAEKVHYQMKLSQGERDKCDTGSSGLGHSLGW